MSVPTRIDSLSALPALLEQLASRRVLIVCGPSRRGLEAVQRLLTSCALAVFDQARQHVPRATFDAAKKLSEVHEADTIVTLGGGAATGLGKVLRRELSLRLVAIPTTYAGSEWTNLFGVTESADKQTGRDDRVLPDAIVHSVDLTADMPVRLTVTSLLNALAHPLGLLSCEELSEALERRALEAVNDTVRVVERLLGCPGDRSARRDALVASGACAQMLMLGRVGEHHRLVHWLGGRYDLNHSELHAVLLPHSVRVFREANPERYGRLLDAVGGFALESQFFDWLVRVQAPTSLAELKVSAEDWEGDSDERSPAWRALLWAAHQGRRPSPRARRLHWGLRYPVEAWGPEGAEAERVVVALHGRGSNAGSMLQRTLELTGGDPTVCVLALQAPHNAWYSQRHTQSREVLGHELATSLSEVLEVLRRVVQWAPGVPRVLLGFSQGACLALEALVQFEHSLHAVVALSGSGIGGRSEAPAFPSHLASTEVLLGASVGDPWLDAEEIALTAAQLQQVGCRVHLEMVPGQMHTFHQQHRLLARPLLTGRTAASTIGGYRGTVETEALPGALPVGRNSPRVPPYGLFAEQVNATGFTAPGSQRQRSWLYRVRPSAQHTAFEPLAHDTFRAEFSERPEVDLAGYTPLPQPDKPTDFVDGLHTVGGAGSASLRRGYAVHLYRANQSMQDRCFCNADGEMLIVPQQGTVTLLTECGPLQVPPGSIAVIPRGLRFSVLLSQGGAAGYVAEVYGRGFALPERGPVGANGLSESRDFRAPSAWHEDRLAVGYQVVHKMGGVLYRALQDYSPYDVVAWHGNWAPYVYDLACFSPVSNARFDHPDPSIFTVLSAPLDEPGSHCLDLVAFVPCWNATENTFRPPYFHRNATMEINGIVRGGSESGPFVPGSLFFTPPMTPHGPTAHRAEREREKSEPEANRPSPPARHSLWIQFESALPFCLTPWAQTSELRRTDGRVSWGVHRSRFGQ